MGFSSGAFPELKMIQWVI